MFKKIGLICLMCGCFVLSGWAQSTMTDAQIETYVKTAVAAGKNQKTIAQELTLKGVSRAQLERVYKKYQESQNKSGQNKKSANDKDTLSLKDRREMVKEGGNGNVSSSKRVRRLPTYLPYNPQVKLDPRRRIYEGKDSLDMIADYEDFKQGLLPDSLRVFGHDIFQTEDLNFKPSDNMAAPKSYRLGPGDEVIIDIFGANQTTIQEEISTEGSINVDVLGPVYLSGKTVEEANRYLKSKLASIYAGLNTNGTQIRLSLGQMRSIQVNVMGEVEFPGTYSLSSFSSVFHALYQAGGVKEAGSMRAIKVNRGGKVIATVDIYDFLMNGNSRTDVHLEDGDVILVPAYANMVKVRGLVKRPMYFEMKQGESLGKLLTYAGGFAKGAYTNSITVNRQNGKSYEVCTVDEDHFNLFAMHDGDEVKVSELLSLYENRLTIKGAVYHAGDYQLGAQINTVRSLVNAAGGLLPDAFTNRAVLHRERPDHTLEVKSIDLAGMMSGKVVDEVLRNNDVLFIPSVYDLRDQGVLTISGEVAAPGVFPYAENTTLEDLIIQAGGLLQSASLARVDISRRVSDANAQTAQTDIAQMYSFSVKDGFVIEGEQGFVLQPYDEVYVRKSPSYSEQRNVEVTGEANFTGTYPLTTRQERLSSLIKKCGGTTDFAYVEGARLVRKINDEERAQMDKVVESMMNDATDSLTAVRLKNYGTEYYVGIDLQKAIDNPGGADDVVLREGDRLEIPVYNNTVRVLGAVTSSNVVTYKAKKNYKYYINEAGGYSDMARKGHAYVVYMNGHISQLKGNTEILPGSEIIVPKRSRPKATFAEVMSSVSGLASLATTIMSLVYVLKTK